MQPYLNEVISVKPLGISQTYRCGPIQYFGPLLHILIAGLMNGMEVSTANGSVVDWVSRKRPHKNM